MTSTSAEAVNSAIAALRLRDIVLQGSLFRRPTIPPVSEITTQQLVKRQVKFVRGDVTLGDKPVKLLQVFVELGTRIVEAGDHSKIYFEIEADFMAEYEVIASLTDEAIKTFSDFNSVHNVWPFWRHHVFDVVQRARIPQIEIPFFCGPGE